MYKNEDFVRLGVRAAKGNRYIWMNCLKATAELYGWANAFPTLLQLKTQTTGSTLVTDTGRRGWKNGGGQTLTICRNPSTHGFPRGQTNSFRVSSLATQKDIRLIAEAVEIDWQWLSTPKTGRRPRSWWQQTSTP